MATVKDLLKARGANALLLVRAADAEGNDLSLALQRAIHKILLVDHTGRHDDEDFATASPEDVAEIVAHWIQGAVPAEQQAAAAAQASVALGVDVQLPTASPAKTQGEPT